MTTLHAAWPRILGALCSALSAALRAASSETRSPGRHAAALDWALGAAPVLGIPRDAFRDALAPPPPPPPLVEAIGKLVAERRYWTGSASQLLSLLQPALDCETPKGVSEQLKKCALALADAGIELSFRRKPGGSRVIDLRSSPCDALFKKDPQSASQNLDLASQPQSNEEVPAA